VLRELNDEDERRRSAPQLLSTLASPHTSRSSYDVSGKVFNRTRFSKIQHLSVRKGAVNVAHSSRVALFRELHR